MARRALVVLLLPLFTCIRQRHHQTVAYKIIPASTFSAILCRERLNNNRHLSVQTEAHLEEANGEYAVPGTTQTRTMTQKIVGSNQSFDCLLQLKELSEKVKEKGYKGDPNQIYQLVDINSEAA